MIDGSIFKAYDIRGVHPKQLDGEVARRVGRAFVDYLGARRIAVGRDVRTSSPEIARGFLAGARALSGDAGIKEIKEWVLAGRYADPTPEPPAEAPPLSIVEDYAKHCLSF